MLGYLMGQIIDIKQSSYTSKNTGNEVDVIKVLLFDEDAFMDQDSLFIASVDFKSELFKSVMSKKAIFVNKNCQLIGRWSLFGKGDTKERKFSVTDIKAL